jgi:hypothetical protein
MEAALRLTRRIGDGDGQALCLCNLATTHLYAGRWDDAESHIWQAVDAAPEGPQKAFVRWPLVWLHSARGERDNAQQQQTELEALADSDDMQSRAAVGVGRAAVALAFGDPHRALVAAEQAAFSGVRLRSEGFRWGWPLAMEGALAADRSDDAVRLLGSVGDAPRGHVPPYLRAQLARYTALLNTARDQHDTVEADLREAITILTDLDYAYWLARAQADLAGWLTTQHRSDEAEPLLAAATATFIRLGARPDLDKARGVPRVSAQR